MGGLYDILESYRLQDPKFTYEGLYQDPRRDDTTNYDGSLMQYPYGGTDADELQAIISSAFPQDYGVGSLFDPRVGRPEQSIYYNEPEPADPTSDFYQPLPNFINAPQNYYPAIRAMQPAPTSLGFDTSYGVANEEDEEQVEYLPGQEPQGIEKLINKISSIPGVVRSGITGVLSNFNPISMLGSFIGGGLGSLRNLNQRIQQSDFGRSKTLSEYFQKRRERKQAERAREANQAVYESARRQGFTNDRGGFSTDRADDAGTSLGSGQFSPSTSRGRSGY